MRLHPLKRLVDLVSVASLARQNEVGFRPCAEGPFSVRRLGRLNTVLENRRVGWRRRRLHFYGEGESRHLHLLVHARSRAAGRVTQPGSFCCHGRLDLSLCCLNIALMILNRGIHDRLNRHGLILLLWLGG